VGWEEERVGWEVRRGRDGMTQGLGGVGGEWGL
jgi:hypothetical protein